MDATACSYRRVSKVNGWYSHWLWTRDGSSGAMVVWDRNNWFRDCNGGVHHEGLYWVFDGNLSLCSWMPRGFQRQVCRRLGRTWVPKLDWRMAISRDPWLELDWEWLLVQKMVLPRIKSKRLWEPWLEWL
eukprot:993073-Ditylum_brightwellii.AAC.1